MQASKALLRLMPVVAVLAALACSASVKNPEATLQFGEKADFANGSVAFSEVKALSPNETRSPAQNYGKDILALKVELCVTKATESDYLFSPDGVFLIHYADNSMEGPDYPAFPEYGLMQSVIQSGDCVAGWIAFSPASGKEITEVSFGDRQLGTARWQLPSR